MEKLLALVIEDDQKLSTIFAEALRVAGFETEIVQDGRKALERLAELVPSLVILDLHLPGVSGKDILEKIRADTRLVDTRVMLATADPLLADTMRDEADLVLIKPISFSQMRDLAMRLRPPDTVN